MAQTRLVVNGAGAAGIACTELLKAMGFSPNNVILCDTKGVIYRGRTEGMNQWKSAHAAETKARTLAEALDGADAVFGLSGEGAFTDDMIRSMADKPIIFAMANPDPEITPEEVARIRDDAIIATGRSDYPNQVNNVLGFPYIFRGALDVRATTINMEMKIAAAQALADLARRTCPTRWPRPIRARVRASAATTSSRCRSIRASSRRSRPPSKAASDSGVARRPMVDMRAYQAQLSARSTRSRERSTGSSSVCADSRSGRSPRARRNR